MADLLLELFSEEIPARMQKSASDSLKSMLESLFKDAGLSFKGLDAYSTPRRITAHVTGLPVKTPDISEERRGPKVGAPDQAVAGFSRGAGVDPKGLIEKDGYYYAKIEQKGAATAEVLSKALPDLIGKFPWPKSMRWGSGSLRWVRPLHSILCILEGKIVPFEVNGIRSGDKTEGHRFMSEGSFQVKDFADYKHQLNKNYVMLDPADRKKIILAEEKKVIQKQGLDLVSDENLLNEVSGLVEWPMAHMGSFDQAFLDIPEEALISEMRHHQKYFPCRDSKTGKLVNKFVFVSNMVTADKGAAITKGNERVLAARLHDAKFFWDQDRKIRLEDQLAKLNDIVFHKKLGNLWWHVLRIRGLAKELSAFIPGCDREMAKQAANLCKADLVSGMVGEFPELQGVMGAYYAAAEGDTPEVVAAIRQHYSPQGPNDTCPTAPVSVAVALADKIATIVFLFFAGERPTGSKDPYALRRAGLGLIRLIVENNLRIPLKSLAPAIKKMAAEAENLNQNDTDKVVQDVLDFLVERLKVQQKAQGVRHDLIDAVVSIGSEDDLVRLLARVNALQGFLGTEDGENLLAGFKRAVNIVTIEEKKRKKTFSGAVNVKLLKEKEELALFDGLEAAKEAISLAVADEKFEEAMSAVANLRAPIDAFFDQVTVNVDDKKISENRLNLLAGFRGVLTPVADFSKIEG